MADSLSIADVERDTGLSKDTLRVWERRYGFPRPRRDAHGERLYPAAQVEKLRAIRRLLDAGHRPAALMACSLGELKALARPASAPPAPSTSTAAVTITAPQTPDDEVGALLELVRGHAAEALRDAFAVAQARLGLRGFVLDIIAPLATRVGDAWIAGELRIYEEHLFTECVHGTLRAALQALPAGAGHPGVLLATLPGEPHGLGLLMAQTLLALEGCRCLSLGVQVPVDDLVAAAAQWPADVVALSVTGASRRSEVLAGLARLRSRLPPATALWVGGAAPALARRPIAGVTRVATLESIHEALAPWRAA